MKIRDHTKKSLPTPTKSFYSRCPEGLNAAFVCKCLPPSLLLLPSISLSNATYFPFRRTHRHIPSAQHSTMAYSLKHHQTISINYFNFMIRGYAHLFDFCTLFHPSVPYTPPPPFFVTTLLACCVKLTRVKGIRMHGHTPSTHVYCTRRIHTPPFLFAKRSNVQW